VNHLHARTNTVIPAVCNVSPVCVRALNRVNDSQRTHMCVCMSYVYACMRTRGACHYYGVCGAVCLFCVSVSFCVCVCVCVFFFFFEVTPRPRHNQARPRDRPFARSTGLSRNGPPAQTGTAPKRTSSTRRTTHISPVAPTCHRQQLQTSSSPA
jgi:hypothetical protein